MTGAHIPMDNHLGIVTINFIIWGYSVIHWGYHPSYGRKMGMVMTLMSQRSTVSTAWKNSAKVTQPPPVNGFWARCFFYSSTGQLFRIGGVTLRGLYIPFYPHYGSAWLVLCPDFCWLSHQLPWIGLVESNCVNPPVTIQKLMDFHSKLLEFRISIVSLPDVW